MKQVIIMIAVILTASTAFALSPLPGTDGNRGNVTSFAPNGNNDGSTTVKSVTVDMTTNGKWLFYGMSTCKYRAMPTSTKAGSLRRLPAATFIDRGVNPVTPFINFTGCKSGEYQRQ